MAQTVVEDPAGGFLFVGNVPSYPHGQQEGDPSISIFKRDLSTGILSLVQSNLPIRPDPGSLAVDQSGHFLYTYGDSRGGHVFAIDQANGTLTEINGSPFPILLGGELFAHPTMPFLYSVSDFGFRVYAYRLDQTTGAPLPLPGSPFSISGEFPAADAVDPTGQFLYVLNDAPGPNLEIFRIQSDGTLSKVPGSPFQVGNGGISLATSPSGDFLFVSTSGDSNDLYSLRVDRSTGQIKSISQVGVQDQSLTIRGIDVSGRFLYATAGNGFFLFAIDSTTGALTFEGPAIASIR